MYERFVLRVLHSSGVTLYNYYGPTETSVYATGKHVLRCQLPGRLASIGKPLPNVTCYVVDSAMYTTTATSAPLLQPIGVWGELWLGGVQVARGYLNRPELTAERFVPNPWPETDPSGRGVVYRTGDRVRWYACRETNKWVDTVPLCLTFWGVHTHREGA